jgi:ankyrin repeat protein
LLLGADVNAGTSLGVLATPLHTAAHFGNQTAIEMLVKHDADPLLLNNLTMAPLHIVAAKGYVGAVEALLPRSTNVLNVQDVYGDSRTTILANQLSLYFLC